MSDDETPPRCSVCGGAMERTVCDMCLGDGDGDEACWGCDGSGGFWQCPVGLACRIAETIEDRDAGKEGGAPSHVDPR